MKRFLFAALLLATPASADVAPRLGWSITPTSHDYADLIDRLKSAVSAEGLIVVTQAGPTQAAKRRGIDIPGNRVIGVFNNDYAVRTLATSTAAMIEAPIRFYVTENADGTGTLSYKTPSHVFAPYSEEGGDDLSAIAADLDAKFTAIAKRAAQ